MLDAGQLIAEFPDHLRSMWHPGPNLVIDTWCDFDVTLEEFRPVIGAALRHAEEHGVRTWVVDTRHATGVLLPPVQAFLAEELADDFVAHGIVRSYNVMPESALATMAVRRYARIDTGFENNFVASLDEVLAGLAETTA